MKLLLDLSRSMSTELQTRLPQALPAVGAPTRIYEPLLRDETIWLRPVDVRRWVATTAKVGVAFASVLKVEKDQALGKVERGRSDDWDALLALSDYALLAVGASAALFGFAFLDGEPVQGSDLPALAARAGQLVGRRASPDNPAIVGALDLLRRVPNQPTNSANSRGLLDLAILVGLVETLAAKAQDALSDPAVLHHDGLPHNPGLQYDRLRRAIPGVPRPLGLFSVSRDGLPPVWKRYDLPGGALLVTDSTQD